MGKERMRFDFERLDVFGVALDPRVPDPWRHHADAVVAAQPWEGRANLVYYGTGSSGYIQDQLRRAANSIALNIAEGAGEFAPAENVGDVGPSMRRARAGQDRRAERGVICW